MEVLRRYTLAELRQISIYLSEFQRCDWVAPENIRQKKCWLNTAVQMCAQKNPENPYEYITRIRRNIRWFIDHKINFRREMGIKTSFYEKIVYDFLRDVTPSTIYFEDFQGRGITIEKRDMIFSNNITVEFERRPTTLIDDNETQFDSDITQFDSDITQFDSDITQLTASIAQISLSVAQIIDTIDLTEVSPQIQTPRITTGNGDEEVTEETRGLECKICTINKICIVLVGCGHTFCNSCTTRFENKCASCRKPFTNANKVRMYI
ncbi:hypothetical protein IIV25_040R [Invertebrate iridovirus 25]|uniref:RING-type domain-containing protein n=1 Tax=Invertebrate iridovirus 25 TaxID=1301280 RepID=W8W1I0_9VIRU|nr:hypothetical protein IIV25_040R [Invertebrate iridovirus 25]CCV02058.1 hypothetical protein IIV25_040R [Invertebrate iridovirus 25]